jgi:hypothetical protein
MTIRDNVDAVHRPLTEDLKAMHLKAVIGFSMGAQQASTPPSTRFTRSGSDRDGRLSTSKAQANF